MSTTTTNMRMREALLKNGTAAKNILEKCIQHKMAVSKMTVLHISESINAGLR